jgi:hypothetical protein
MAENNGIKFDLEAEIDEGASEREESQYNWQDVTSAGTGFEGFYPESGKTTWDKFNNMSARDERRMLKSEGEGD